MKTEIITLAITIAAALYFGVHIAVSDASLYVKMPVCIVFAFVVIVCLDSLIHVIQERRAR